MNVSCMSRIMTVLNCLDSLLGTPPDLAALAAITYCIIIAIFKHNLTDQSELSNRFCSLQET